MERETQASDALFKEGKRLRKGTTVSAVNPVTFTNIATWIPEIWSKEIVATQARELVVGSLLERDWKRLGVGTQRIRTNT